MGGSGSGGGGGSSGTVDYPEYMKNIHQGRYNYISDLVQQACDSNPYWLLQAQDPTTMFQTMEASVDYLDKYVQVFDPRVLWETLMLVVPQKVTALVKNSEIDDYVDAQKDRLRSDFENDVVPRFRRGMQDIGAVMTSAFKIGEALLRREEIRQEAELEKEYKGKFALASFEYCFKSVNDILQMTMQKIGYTKDVIHYKLEAQRLGYVAFKEYKDSQNVYEIERIKWCLEMNKYAMDAIGCIASSAGTSYTTSSGGSSRVGSAIGGALGGAGIGAMAGSVLPGVGTVAGAVAGGAMGLAAGLFS